MATPKGIAVRKRRMLIAIRQIISTYYRARESHRYALFFGRILTVVLSL